MKNVIKALFVLFFTFFTVSGALAAEKKNKPEIMTVDNYVAVFDFEVRTKDKDISRSLADSVIHEFSKSERYEVIDRGNMNKILKEQKFQMSGCVAQECKVEAGQILGVGKIVNGSVGLVGKTYYLTLQLIDVKTGKVDLSAEDKCKCEVDELLDSTKRLAKRLLGEEVKQPVTTAPKLATVVESKAEAEEIAKAKAKAEATAKAKSEAEALAKTEAKQQELKATSAAVAPPAVNSTTTEIARDGRFIAYNNGTVLDTKTNLMWAAKDNGSGINWANAWSYSENYRGGGYTDWRMPTQDELAGLYDSNKSYKATQRDYFVHLTELIQLSACCPWASETRGSDTAYSAYFDFDDGKRNWNPRFYGNSYRAVPVRSGK